MKLTPREREVIELVAAGETTKAIAKIMGISPYTVRDYLKNSMQRNGWHTRVQAAMCLLQESNNRAGSSLDLARR